MARTCEYPPVGASLLAIAAVPAPSMRLPYRYREQARSHRVLRRAYGCPAPASLSIANG